VSGSSRASLAVALLAMAVSLSPAEEIDLDWGIRNTTSVTIGPAGAALDLHYPIDIRLSAELSSLVAAEAEVEIASRGELLSLAAGVVYLRPIDRLIFSAGRAAVGSGYGTEYSAGRFLSPIDCDSIWGGTTARVIPQDLFALSWTGESVNADLTVVPRYRFGQTPSSTGAWSSHQGIPTTFEFPAGTIRTLNTVIVEPAASTADGLEGTSILAATEITLPPFRSYALLYAGEDRARSPLSVYDYPITPYEFDYRLRLVPTDALLAALAGSYDGDVFDCWFGVAFGRRERLVASFFHAEQAPTDTRTWVTYQGLTRVFAISPTIGASLAVGKLQATVETSFEFVTGIHPEVTFPTLSRIAMASISWEPAGPPGLQSSIESDVVTRFGDGLTVVKPRVAFLFDTGMEIYVSAVLPLSPFGLVGPGPGEHGTILAGIAFEAVRQ
jgi:hypothetical protein